MTELVVNSQDFERLPKRAAVEVSTRPSLSYWKDAWIRLAKNSQALASLVLVALLLAFTGIGPALWALDPSTQELSRISQAPSRAQVVRVLAELPPYEEVVLEGVPAAPEPPAAGLEATAKLELLGEPSTESVRLRWSPVPGAAGYAIYRGDAQPTSSDGLGVPVGETDAGNKVSYEDRFNLEPRTFHYAVVAKNGEESTRFRSLKVEVRTGLPLPEALALRPESKPGDELRLEGRPLGTDYLGRDLLARLIHGARVSLFIGFFAPLISILIGVLVGGVSGFFGGRVDHTIMRVTDFVLALPFLLFMILFKVAFGAGPGEDGIFPMLVAMISLSWTGSARLTRGQILQLRESEFVHAARLLGARPAYLILRHLLPNTLGVILVSLTFAIPSAIFTEAFLSFIGMGVAPPTPSWGSMCNDGIRTFLTHPHEFIFPALLISVTVLAFNLLGDGLRDALDPKMRGKA